MDKDRSALSSPGARVYLFLLSSVLTLISLFTGPFLEPLSYGQGIVHLAPVVEKTGMQPASSRCR